VPKKTRQRMRGIHEKSVSTRGQKKKNFTLKTGKAARRGKKRIASAKRRASVSSWQTSTVRGITSARIFSCYAELEQKKDQRGPRKNLARRSGRTGQKKKELGQSCRTDALGREETKNCFREGGGRNSAKGLILWTEEQEF